MTGRSNERVIRTPDERFDNVADYGFAPNYVQIADDDLGSLRMHYVDEGPRDAAPVLLMHGQPTWSFLYRKVIRELVGRGHRVVAPDNIGFGRSDKPTNKYDYTFQRHLDWHQRFVEAIDLRNITVFGQDWGGPFGLGVLAAVPERFDRVVVANTILHCADPAFADRLDWANHGIDNGRVVLEEALLDYIMWTQRAPALDMQSWMSGAAIGGLSPSVVAAYEAPFPDETYMAGVRQLTAIIPVTRNDPGSVINRNTWAALGKWDKPFLTAFSDLDPATRGFESLFQERVPGAAGVEHVTIAQASHFVQEDQGEELGRVISDFIGQTGG